jgi:predicted DNA-binding protein
MVTDKRLTAIRLGDEDRKILEKLQKLTGLDSAAAIIRLAIREALATRQKRRK